MSEGTVGPAALTEEERQRLADALYGKGRATGRYCGGPVFEVAATIKADALAARADRSQAAETLEHREGMR